MRRIYTFLSNVEIRQRHTCTYMTSMKIDQHTDRLVHVKKNKITSPGEYPRCFFDSDHEILHVSCACPCIDLACFFLFLFCSPDFSSVKIFRKILTTLAQIFSAKKKKKRRSDLGMGYVEHVCKIQGSISQNRHGHLDFVRKNDLVLV